MMKSSWEFVHYSDKGTGNAAGPAFQALDPLISDGLRDLRYRKRSGDMADVLWLSDAQMARLEP